MATHYSALGLKWDTALFKRSWPTTLNYTLEVAGTVAGFLRLAQIESVVRIRDIQLADGFKGQGIGSFAIEATERFAKERGLETIQLSAFRSNPAIRLYERHGFREVGESEGVVTFEKHTVRNDAPAVSRLP